MIASRLLWRAAGRPVPDQPWEPYTGPCWWCGLPSDGHGRPVSDLPDTFPALPAPAVPSASHLCEGCGWALSDRIRVPHETAKLAARAESGGRVNLARGRRLVLRLADGTLGLWDSPGNAASEEPWLAARDDLRASPADVGAIRYEGAVTLDDLAPAPKEKFRNYHHVGSASRGWTPYTNADRQALRAWLLNPPDDPWACVIGDGQKHAAIHAPVSPGRPARPGYLFERRDPVQALYYDGAVVEYRPADLARWVEAVEALILAGHGDDDIRSGRYTARDLAGRMAVLEHEPVLAPLRGGPRLELSLFLRRPRAALEAP